MLIYALVFLLGTIVASFLNVVAQSLPVKQNWWSRRSCCKNCQAILTPRQLIPIFSYLWQRGRCLSCHSKIPPSYLLTEIIGGVLFVIPLLLLPNWDSLAIIQAWSFFALLLTVTLTDLYYRLIPNKILLIFGTLLFFLHLNVGAAIFGFGFFYATSKLGTLLFQKATIGGGDIKLYFVIGLVLPIQPLLISITISSTVALSYLLIFVKQKNTQIPFAPFIAIGAVVSYLTLIH